MEPPGLDAGCLTFLRSFDRDLEEAFPRLHIYVHGGYLVQPATSRRGVSSVEDIPEIERIAASESPPSSIASPVLTPRKASPSRAAGPSAQEGYTVAPGQYLRKKAGGVDTLMLQLLEQHGASASRGALRIVRTAALEELQRQGIRAPTSDGWADHSRAISEACVAIGDVHDEEVYARLMAGLTGKIVYG
ncbi:MAG: hypothetical protein SGPRY_001617 [Prymnesium sp.]